MAASKDINICIFKPLKCDTSSTDGYLSAHLEGPNVHGSGKSSDRLDVPLGSLILTAWALLLKYYLATDLVSFASSGIEHVISDARDDKDKCGSISQGNGTFEDLIHSLEIEDDELVSNIIRRIRGPATQRSSTPELLSCVNTMILYGSPKMNVMHRGMVGNSVMDVVLTLTNDRGVLSLHIALCATKFSQLLAHRLLYTYHHILGLISAENPSQTVNSLNPLTGYDLDQIYKWNTNVPRCRNACLHSIFEQQAQRRPWAPAVCSWDGDLTYAELNRLSTKLAQTLSRLCVGPEIFVPYAFEKSIYAVVATLAVLKAGGAFVPVDVSHPRSRLESIIKRVGAMVVLASAKTRPAFEGLSLQVVVVDQLFLDGLPDEESNPYSEVSPRNSAFVLFTSGSTGEPKGLVQEHASVCTVNEAYGENLFVNDESRVLNFAAHTFDVSTVDVFNTLYHGGCVCIPSEEDRLNDIVRVINKFRVSWVDLTPSFAMASIPRPNDIPTLKTLILAGEEIKQEHVAHFVGKISQVINCYGPAEAGGCLANVYQSTTSQPQTVGVALKSASCWIVDSKNPYRLAPIGAIGELVVEGHTLARGYLEDPAKTDAAFFSHCGWHPHENKSSQRRFYKTGDLVHYRPDGMINFVGRRDTQVKIRGQRIELTEIEQHLSGVMGIKGSIVEFPQSGIYARRLVAVVEPYLRSSGEHIQHNQRMSVLSAKALLGSEFSIQNSTRELSKQIPAYMMPAIWLTVNKLPLTDSKKVDRRTVRDWLTQLPISDNILMVAGTSRTHLCPLENKLAFDISHEASKIIANGNGQIFAALDGQNFDLLAAGIDSIQIMTLSIWIRDKYGLKLTVSKLTRPGLTIDELAGLVAASKDGRKLDKMESSELNIEDEVCKLSRNFSRPAANIIRPIVDQPISTVLLTGGTGFLGIEILHQLLCNYNIKKVFVHIRATSVQHGRERIVAAATKAAWWSPSFDHRLEIWPGDLVHVRLGLRDEQWDGLIGNATTETQIDAVIHNGADVRWNLGYECLKNANTLSTLQLLEAMADRRSSGRFVYVSGGQVLTTGDDDGNANAAQGEYITGYAQTKIVSERLVKRFAESKAGQGHLIHVIKPSYIIGDPKRGMANEEDYMWRFTKSAIELGTLNRDGRDSWLFVSDVVTVAAAVCKTCSAKEPRPTIIKILDGLFMHDFWDILTQDFGYELKPVDAETWWCSLRSHVEQSGSQHCLWALQDILKARTGEIASIGTVPTTKTIQRSSHILEAVRSNVQYLRDVKQFFPPVSSICDKPIPAIRGTAKDTTALGYWRRFLMFFFWLISRG